MSYKTKGLVGAMEEAVVKDQSTPSEGEIISASAEMNTKINDFNDDTDYISEVEDEAVALEKIRELLLTGDPSVTAQSIARVHTEAFARRHGIRLNNSPSLESYSGNVVAIEGVLGKVGTAISDAFKYVIKKIVEMIDWFLNLIGLKKKKIDNMDKTFDEGKEKMTEKFEQVLKKAPDPKKEAETIKAGIKKGSPIDELIKDVNKRIDDAIAEVQSKSQPIEPIKSHKFQKSDDVTDVVPKEKKPSAPEPVKEHPPEEIKRLAIDITKVLTENAEFSSATIAKKLWFGGLGGGHVGVIPKVLDMATLDKGQLVLENHRFKNINADTSKINFFTEKIEQKDTTVDGVIKEYNTLHTLLTTTPLETTKLDSEMAQAGYGKHYTRMKSDFMKYSESIYMVDHDKVDRLTVVEYRKEHAPELTDEQYSKIVIKVPTKEQILAWKKDCLSVESTMKELSDVKSEMLKTAQTFSKESRGEGSKAQDLGADIGSKLIRMVSRKLGFVIEMYKNQIEAYTTLADIHRLILEVKDLEIIV